MGACSSENLKNGKSDGIGKSRFSLESDAQWAKIIEQFNQSICNLKDYIKLVKQEISVFSDIIFYNCKTNNKSEGLKCCYQHYILERYLHSLEDHFDDLIEQKVSLKMMFNKWISNPFDQMLLSYITNKAIESNSFLELLRKLLKVEAKCIKERLNKKDDFQTMFLIDLELRDEIYEKLDMIVIQSKKLKNETLQIKNTVNTRKTYVSDKNCTKNQRIKSFETYNVMTLPTADNSSETKTSGNFGAKIQKTDDVVHLQPVPLNFMALNSPNLSFL